MTPHPLRIHLRRQAASIGLAAGGLLVALAAALPGPEAPPPGPRPEALAVRLPDAVGMTVVALLVLAALLLLMLLAPRGIRRRRKGDEEFELYHEPPKIPVWLQCALWLVALAPLGALLAALWLGASFPPWLGGASPGGAGPGRSALSTPLPGTPPTAPGLEAPPVSMPGYATALAVVTVLAALGSLGLIVWLWIGERLAWWWAGPMSGPDRAPLAAAVDESLEDLRREPDPRRAIIRCYRHFERALGASRLPRAPWQTPVEFVSAALGRLPLPSGPALRLTRLFEIARFSERPLGRADRADALDALTSLRHALQGDDHHDTPV